MGCGFGRNLIALKKRFPKIQTWYALDYSLNGIAATLANLDIEKLDLGGELICGDFRKTSLPDQSVDYVFSFWSLPYGCIESPQNQEEILAEMLRITRKGILLIEPDFSSHLYGIRKPTGYWDFEKLKSSIKSRGLPFHDEKLSIRMNPFIDVHEIRISLA
jgi:ubiquinone/menaquinone biosynthesis C-methylase UbiE